MHALFFKSLISHFCLSIWYNELSLVSVVKMMKFFGTDMEPIKSARENASPERAETIPHSIVSNPYIALTIKNSILKTKPDVFI